MSEAVVTSGPRRRGAPKGNRNAVKHGRYARQAAACASVAGCGAAAGEAGHGPPESEVQFEKQIRAPRGAPKGNQNRLKHGHWSAEFVARRREIGGLLQEARGVIARLDKEARTRRDLARAAAQKEAIANSTGGA